MLFSSLPFILFFSIVFFVYYLLAKEKQWLILTVAGFLFYCWYDFLHCWVPLFLIVVTWYSGKQIKNVSDEKKRYRFLLAGVLSNLFLLIGFKYAYFFLTAEGITDNESGLVSFFREIAVPLGISYISFQSIGYLIDVHKGKISAEKNITSIAGYLLFFPKMIAGPVEAASQFLPQIKKVISFDYTKVSSGIRQFGWGMFKKLVIADRLGLFVNSVYADLPHNYGISIWITAFFFPIQLYADFSGYTDMAIGIARILGYELTPNFNNPFGARSMVEFWRRWHMSLSSWFNEYIYTPLAIQKRNWGKWSVVYASTITFLILGLWHGPNWTYVVFGGIQGCVIAVELFTIRQRKQIRKNIPEELNALIGIAYVFFVFAFSCIFFRAGTLTEAGSFLSHLFTGEINGSALKNALQGRELAIPDYVVIIISIPLMLFVEWKQLPENLAKASKWIRWMIYYLFLIFIIAYGINHSAFIYKQF